MSSIKNYFLFIVLLFPQPSVSEPDSFFNLKCAQQVSYIISKRKIKRKFFQKKTINSYNNPVYASPTNKFGVWLKYQELPKRVLLEITSNSLNQLILVLVFFDNP